MSKHIYTDNRSELSARLIEARETANLTQKQVQIAALFLKASFQKSKMDSEKWSF